MSAAKTASRHTPDTWPRLAISSMGPGPKRLLQWAVLGPWLGVAHGYACTGYGPVANQYFVLPDRNLTGVIHGWISDCYDYTYACGQHCGSTYTAHGESYAQCTTLTCPATRSAVDPTYYVAQMASAVRACGFDLVEEARLVDPVRVPNGLLERNFRVKVSVNRLNTSSAPDPAVSCLYHLT